MGEANVIIGIKISKTFGGLVLFHCYYVQKILNKTHVSMNLLLTKNNDQSLSQTKYSQIIGCLMYLMNCTHSDIAYSLII